MADLTQIKSFGLMQHFAGAKSKGKTFTFSMDNAAAASQTAADVNICMMPGWCGSVSELANVRLGIINGIITEGTVTLTGGSLSTTNVFTARGKGSSINHIQNAWKHTPMHITEMKIQASNVDQLDEPIEFYTLDEKGLTFRGTFTPSSEASEYNQNDKIITIDLSAEELYTGQDLVVVTKMKAGRNASYSFSYDQKWSYKSMVEQLNSQL